MTTEQRTPSDAEIESILLRLPQQEEVARDLISNYRSLTLAYKSAAKNLPTKLSLANSMEKIQKQRSQILNEILRYLQIQANVQEAVESEFDVLLRVLSNNIVGGAETAIAALVHYQSTNKTERDQQDLKAKLHQVFSDLLALVNESVKQTKNGLYEKLD